MKEKLVLYKKSPKAVTVYCKNNNKYVVGVETTFQVDWYGNVLSEIDTKDVVVVDRFRWFYENEEVIAV